MATKIIGKVSIVPYGDWQENTTYPRLAVVGYQGSSYIAVVENTNITPTDTSSWKQIAAAGNGISSIEKISTVGLVDTYRITYTNGDHFDFEINNGATKTSELTNDSGFIDKDVNNLTNYLLKTDTGATIEITYDSSAYTVTANLKNSSNTTISTSTIQLPAGSSVVNASYDEADYTITLTQRDGTEITLDLANNFNAKEDVENKIDTLDGNATEDQYPNAKITYEKVHELQEQGVSQEIQDQKIFLYDASNLPSKEIDILGNTIQNGVPTTSNPVDINVVTGDNTLKVVGKNILNINDTYSYRYAETVVTITGNTITLNNSAKPNANGFVWWNIPVVVGYDYTISYENLTESATNSNNRIEYCFSDTVITTYASLPERTSIDKTTKKATASATNNYLIISVRVNNGASQTTTGLMIEQSSTASSYESYIGKEVTLPLASLELASVESVRDVLFHNVLENSYYNGSLTMGSYYKLSNIGKIASYSGETITTPYISTTGILSTGATVYYQLSAPIYTEITDSTLIGKLNELEVLSLLSGYNYIYSSATSPNANPYLNLIYIRDLNLVVDEFQNIDNLLLNQSFTKNTSGTMIHIEDGGDLPLKELDFEGQTSQIGTPTPDTPVDVNVVTGDNTVVMLGKNLIDLSTGWTDSSNTTSSWANETLMITSTSGNYNRCYKEITNIIKKLAGKTLRFSYESYNLTEGKVTVQLIIDKYSTTTKQYVTMWATPTFDVPSDVSDYKKVELGIYQNNQGTSAPRNTNISKTYVFCFNRYYLCTIPSTNKNITFRLNRTSKNR